MADNKKETERAELHRTIWGIANDLRGSVDGWDFKQYVLGMLFYRYISENLDNYISKGEWEAGNKDFHYSNLSDKEAETVKDTFPLMCDLLFMLARTHDVLIAEDFIKEGKSETNSIFYNNETGNKIMIMLIQLLHTNTEVKEFEIYNSYYSSLFKKVVNTFFFPYKNHKREFDDSFYNKKLI